MGGKKRKSRKTLGRHKHMFRRKKKISSIGTAGVSIIAIKGGKDSLPTVFPYRSITEKPQSPFRAKIAKCEREAREPTCSLQFGL